ncbi:MAG: cyclopropane fatty acyl phospholipid synthase [Parcubacteria group bacterium]|nr:cyclopropane fatty acyl phospholipid synthase [Parcubacteria group bacterium]
MSQAPKKFIESLAEKAGIVINGKNPWDIQVHDERLYGRIMREGTLGLGEAYMDGWWDVLQLDEFFNKVLQANLKKHIRLNVPTVLNYVKGKLFNTQIRKAFQVGKAHYDLGNDVYKAMLDKRMTYTSGYWKNAKTLDEAQEAKLDLVCRKLGLKKGQRILDIGSGWGSFMMFAAERYGVSCVGITVSKEQHEYVQRIKGNLSVETRLMDYNDVGGAFDHIVSLGMFEHVGYKNYRRYMKKVSSLLKDDGLFLLHTIGSSVSVPATDPWIAKYIFPNGMIPSIKQIGDSIEHIFVMEDWHNFGADYDITLMHWYDNFMKQWPQLKDTYGERFCRTWKYYLLASAGSFRSRKNQLWQIVLSKKGVIGGYSSVR